VNAAFVYDAVRTPFGRIGKGLAGVRPDDLAAHIVRTLVDRAPGLDPERIDDVFLGNANGAGEENRDVARMAVLLADLPTSVTGTTVNRLCGSSLDAAMQASRMVETGDASLTLAGGVESMSRAPWVLLKPGRPYPTGHETLHSTTLGWRMVNPRMPDQWTISLGLATEKLVGMHDVSREDQDAFAARSHQATHAAWEDGFYDDWVVPVPDTDLERDEGIRPEASVETLAKLKPAFTDDGSVTAGNSSPLNDGAAALWIGDEAAGAALGQEPLARIAGRGAHGVDPDVFGVGPVEAANRALARAGIGWSDLAAVELNEAFAGQSVACLQKWPDLDPALVNSKGGAIAIGHPLGASGARILGTLVRRLREPGGGWGLAAICIGVGQGLAVVVEAP
jgi:acetyl-CoA acetyltransferase family protein